MYRLLVSAILAAAVFAVPAGAFERPERTYYSSAQSANDRMPFPALMNSLFGRDRSRAARAPEARFRRPAERAAPRPRVERAPASARQTLRARNAPQPQARQARVAPQRGNRTRQAPDPRYQRQTVPYSGGEAPGTIVVNTAERFLYLVQADGTALRYGVGVGRQGFSWSGTERITRKAEWPSWRPPEAMKRRQPELPDYMPGGPNNPLGARALYLGSTLYRIHGSNEPWTIGQAMSSGCIRMTNDDVKDLYERVSVGAKVIVR